MTGERQTRETLVSCQFNPQGACTLASMQLPPFLNGVIHFLSKLAERPLFVLPNKVTNPFGSLSRYLRRHFRTTALLKFMAVAISVSFSPFSALTLISNRCSSMIG